MEINQEECNKSIPLSLNGSEAILLAMGIGGTAAVIVCLAALVMALYFKLYQYFIHRLAIYQVLAAMLYALVCVLELIVNGPLLSSDRIDELLEENTISDWPCIVAGFLLQYTLWLKLMFTFCLTFHLFCFAVLHKKYDKLELVYVVLSVVVPLLFNWIPFIKLAYGQAGAWCWIKNWNNNNPNCKFPLGEVEQYTLLYGPALIGLSIATVAVTVVTVVLIFRAIHNDVGEQEPLLRQKQQRKVLKEVLPLVAYPVLSVLFYIPAFINRLIGSLHHVTERSHFVSFMWSGISLSSLGVLAGLALIVHILILNPSGIRKRRMNIQHNATAADKYPVFTDDTLTSTITDWNPIGESISDDDDNDFKTQSTHFSASL